MERALEQKILKGILASRLFFFSTFLILISTVPFFLNPQNFRKTFSSEKAYSQFSYGPLTSNISHHSVSVQNILTLPEENIDVGIAALTFAKEISRGLDKYYLNRILDTKEGNCSSMPLLYIAVSQRLGWPVYLVHVPDHSFVRYVDPGLKEQNIEATSTGGYVSDEKYAKDFMVSEAGKKKWRLPSNIVSSRVVGRFGGHNWRQKNILSWPERLQRNVTNWDMFTLRISLHLHLEKYIDIYLLYETIAKGWVEAHGGKIWAESDGEGRGTTITFTLPI